ncbi:DUF1616 domain-containing protein [Halorientalis halophila]|uniref:DUF1616 domain-containing protein n=1 Tax=Halorientalis halophila TaxID=3108499 RepID=UPI003008BFAF
MTDDDPTDRPESDGPDGDEATSGDRSEAVADGASTGDAEESVAAEEDAPGPTGRSAWLARGERVLTWVLALALLLSLAGVVYVAMVPPETTDPYTEFYILGPDGNASGYPTQLAPGDTGTVIVGITNHEQRDVDYRVAVTWNGSQSFERNVSVADEATEEFRVSLSAPDESGRYRVLFHLTNEAGGEPTPPNRLWIDVGNETVDAGDETANGTESPE